MSIQGTLVQRTLDLEKAGPGSGLDVYGRFLLRYARAESPLPGRTSASRKFRRRYAGRRFKVKSRHGFWIEGVIGDSVETQCAVHREFEPGLSRLLVGLSPKVSTFIDLGCNIGYFTCLLAAHQPKARIIAVDANPRVLETCRRNLEVNESQATVLHCAIGDGDKPTTLNIPRGRATRGTLGDARGVSDWVESVPVEMRRLSTLLAEQRLGDVDLIKIDIEGYESRLLANIEPDTAARCEAIIFEFSEANLAQCGCCRADFDRVEWLSLFSIFLMNPRTGHLSSCPSLGAVRDSDASLVLYRKSGARKLRLEPWITPA